MEPILACKDTLPVNIARLNLGNRRRGAVVHHLGCAHGSTVLKVVCAKSFALSEYVGCVNAPLPDVVDACLPNVVVRNGGDKTCIDAEVRQ